MAKFDEPDKTLQQILVDQLRSGDNIDDVVGALLDAANEVIPHLRSVTAKRMQLQAEVLAEALDIMLQEETS